MIKFSSNKTINTIIFAALIVAVSLVLTFLISLAEPYQRLQNSTFDSFFRLKTRLFKPEKGITDDVVIIAIDELSLKNFQEQKNILWPWPRNIYSIIAQHAVNEGAKAVLFDIVFSSPDIDRLTGEGYSSDMRFKKTIENTDKVVVAFNIDDILTPMNILNDIVVNTYERKISGAIKNDEDRQFINSLYTKDDTYGIYSLNKELDEAAQNRVWDIFEECGYIIKTRPINNVDNFEHISEYSTIFQPYELFHENNINLGYVDTKGDIDGVIREYRPLVKVLNNYYPSLASACYLMLNDNKLPEELELNRNGNFKLRWYGEGGVNKTYKYVPVMMIISDYINTLRKRPTELEEGIFKDKVVFVGASARGLLDMKNTPFSKKEAYPGVEIHATGYLNMVNEDWVRQFPFIIELLIYILSITGLTFFGINTLKPIRYSLIYWAAVIGIFGLYFIFFSLFNVIFQLAFYFCLVLFTFIFTQITNYITIGHDRNVIKNAFNSYISPDILKQISEKEEPLSVKGDNQVATAMFIDIAGFTTFSEKNSVEKVVETLNLYLKRFSEVIIDNHGFINKYLGDGLMALFGAPNPLENHADMAVKSAIECFAIKNELEAEYGLNVRIGINSGDMIVGNLGGKKKLEYTAIGDSVNTASRLEGANKFFSTNILIGENTRNLMSLNYSLLYAGKFSLKGKDIPYGMFFYLPCLPEEHAEFERLITAYEDKDIESFKQAIDYFRIHNKKFGPAVFYKAYFDGFKDKFGEPIKFTQK